MNVNSVTGNKIILLLAPLKFGDAETIICAAKRWQMISAKSMGKVGVNVGKRMKTIEKVTRVCLAR